MTTIWKITLSVLDWQEHELPVGAEILCVQVQHGKPQMWVKCSPHGGKVEPREFRIYGTGHMLAEMTNHKYIGTFQLDGGAFVGHLFETT